MKETAPNAFIGIFILGLLFYYLVKPPTQGSIVEGCLIEVGFGRYREIADNFPYLPFLPIIGNLPDFVFLVSPDKYARQDFTIPEPGKHLDSFVQLLRMIILGFGDMPVPPCTWIKTGLAHI